MILVTGGTGFLGSELIKQLSDAGHSLRALKRINSIIPSLLKNLSNVEWFEADINEPETLEEAFVGVNQVYHCAAFVSFNPSDKKKLFHINIDGTSNIVNLCLDYGCRLVHVSSVAALGDAKKGAKITEKDYWEGNTKTHSYGISKYEGEMEVWRGVAEGLGAVIVNPSVIIGKNAGFNGSGAIFKLVKDGFKFYTDGATGLVDVEDVAKAMILLMSTNISAERFIISSEDYHYKDFFATIASGFNVKAPSMEAKPWMLGLTWRALKFISIFTGKQPSITKDAAKSSLTLSYYNNSKIIKATGINFKPVATTINEITQSLT
jgi:dihydroflavonol-4-reductase